MMLAFNIADIVQVPFGYLLDWLYQFTNSYGWALILFAVIVKLVLLPTTAKSKKSTMKMSRLTPQIQFIQKKYANDQQKQSEAMQALYKAEGVSMGGGCLWSFVPLLIMLPLYSVVRQPILYLLHESWDTTCAIMNAIKGTEGVPGLLPDLIGSSNTYFEQMLAAPKIPEIAAQLKEMVPAVSDRTLQGLNFSFLGIDLAAIPNINIFAWETYNWSTIGGFMVPILSAGSQVLSMFISQKMNNSLVTDEKGLQDKETAKNSQANQTSKVMMWMMPLMSLWIGFSYPVALSLYWLITGVVTTLIDVYLTRKYRKIYDAEDASRLRQALLEEEAELERERIRAERRAANPDGITTNTSKKKLQQKQQKEQEAAKAAAQKEYAAKKGLPVEEEPEKPKALSGIEERPFCKGRAYDPERYAESTEE